MQEFSYSFFSNLIETSKLEGYKISSFEKYDSSNPKTIILRHDIDYTLNGVLDLSEIENSKVVTSTFLFRVHADEYNLFCCTSLVMLNELKKMGHEIGLHFEAMNVGRALELDPPTLLQKEKKIIETILGTNVLTCSEHRELSNQIHKTKRYDEIYDPYEHGFKFYAMDKKYSQQMKYLSDSNANWREGNPLQHFGKHSRMQILIHPDWWFKKDLLLKGPYVHPRGTHI